MPDLPRGAMNGLRVGSIFSGIGGFDLGFERAGMRVVWQAESNPFCRSVLRHHWPDVPCYEDVRDIDGSAEPIDLLCGGFPCQDISSAGAKAGIGGEQSGLWSEYARIICELRPRYIVVENVAALLARGLDVVLGDLAEIGMAAEWGCIRAADVGAPHLRDRLWLVGYPDGSGESVEPVDAETPGMPQLADPNRIGRDWRPRVFGPGWWRELEDCGWWADQPGVCGVDDGLPAGLDGGRAQPPPSGGSSVNRGKRLAALGNALVPQIAEYLGRRIIEAEPLVRGSHW